MPASPEDLQAIVAKMRELGVTEYAGIKLGPEPVSPGNNEDEPSDSQAIDETKRRAERQRLSFLASGGPVKSSVGRSQ